MNSKYDSENKYLIEVKQTNGITLMVLVVTLIILLIITGVTIGILTNSDLFERAKTATDKYTNSSEKEQLELNELYNQIVLFANSVDDETESDDTGNPNAVYQIGDEVTVGGERFYVFEPCSAEQTTVTLLAKYNLSPYGTSQLPNASYLATWCNFSIECYWEDAYYAYTDWDTKQFNIATVEGKNSKGDAIMKAKYYAILKGGTDGRLMTYEEADSLKESYGHMIWGKANRQGASSSDYYLVYWLSSATDDVNIVWYINGNEELLGGYYSNYYDGEKYGSDDSHDVGVRPIITVPKTKVHIAE